MSDDRGRVLVFAPSPLLTVTIEDRGGEPDIHLHAGGQGVWQARMIAEQVLAGNGAYVHDDRGDARAEIAEMPGERLDAALSGGLACLKVAHDELVADGRAADEPALAMLGEDDQVVEVHAPTLHPTESRGAGARELAERVELRPYDVRQRKTLR